MHHGIMVSPLQGPVVFSPLLPLKTPYGCHDHVTYKCCNIRKACMQLVYDDHGDTVIVMFRHHSVLNPDPH